MIKARSLQFDEMIFKLLREIHRLENLDMERFKLSWRDIHVLNHLLKHSHCRVSDIASELDMPLFAVSRLIAALTERGYVNKSKDNKDKRNTNITLTPEGAGIIRQVEANYYSLFSSNLELMEEGEAELMISSMGNVSRLLEAISMKKKIKPPKPKDKDPFATEIVF